MEIFSSITKWRDDAVWQNVSMDTEILHCPVCSQILKRPIFQCSLGHFICSSCHGERLRGSKCRTCSRTSFDRAHGMEIVLFSIKVPCSYAKHGCTEKMFYHLREDHEKACPAAPCFCPDSPCCGFAGSPAKLIHHINANHKEWPMTAFEDNVPFNLPVEKTGLHVLREIEDGHVFVVNVTFAEHVGYGVSLASVQPDGEKPRFVCSAEVLSSCYTGRYRAWTLENVSSSSLSDGPPTRCFITVPPYTVLANDDLVIGMTIYKTYDDDGDDDYYYDDD